MGKRGSPLGQGYGQGTADQGFDWNEFPAVQDPQAPPPPAAPAAVSGPAPASVPPAQAAQAAAPFNWNDHPPVQVQSKAPPGVYDTFIGPAGEAIMENVVVPVGRAIDKYTGAPTRAAVGSLQENGADLGAAAQAFKDQWGQDPEKAPTGKQLAQRAGVPDTKLSEVLPSLFSDTGEGWRLQRGGPLDVSGSGAAGLGLDIATDWSNVVPVSTVAKGAVKVGEGALKVGAGAARVAGRVAEAAIPGGRILTGAGEVAAESASRVGELLKQTINPKIVPTWEQAVEVAKRNGIDPEKLSANIKYGERSEIARKTRVVAEGPGGAQILERHYEGYKQISDAIDNRIKKMAGGELVGAKDAGEVIHEGLKKAQAELMDSENISYRSAGKYAPGLMVNRQALEKFNNQLTFAEREARNMGLVGSQKDAANALIGIIGDIRSAVNRGYDKGVDALQSLGKEAFEGKPIIGKVPPDVKKLRDLYQKLSETLTTTVAKDINPDFAKELVINNKAKADFFKDRSIIQDALDSTKAGENIFQKFVVNGNSKTIDILKERLPPEEFAKLKGAMMDTILKQNKDGLVVFSQARNVLDKKFNQVSRLLDEGEMKDLGELIKLGEAHGIPVMSTSGTGASLAFHSRLRNAANEVLLKRMEGRAETVAKEGPMQIPSVSLDSNSFGPTARGPRENAYLKAPQSAAPSYYGQPKKQNDQGSSGEDKWAVKGFGNLLPGDSSGVLRDSATIDRIFESPSAKRLLIRAADLPPGSPQLKKVYEQLQQEITRGNAR